MNEIALTRVPARFGGAWLVQALYSLRLLIGIRPLLLRSLRLLSLDCRSIFNYNFFLSRGSDMMGFDLHGFLSALWYSHLLG